MGDVAGEAYVRLLMLRWTRRRRGAPEIVYLQTEPGGPYRSVWVYGFDV